MGDAAKKWIKTGICLCSAAMLYTCSFAQEAGHDQMEGPAKPQVYSPFSLESGGELWYPLKNYALKNNFGGVYSFHLSLQHVLYKRLYGGLELQDNEISQVSPEAIQIAILKTNLFFYSVGAKLSYYSSQNNDWLFSFSLVAGQSWLFYTKVSDSAAKPPGGFKKQALFFCPRICESLRVNSHLKIGVELTYTLYNYTFNPQYIGIMQSYTKQQTSGTTTLFGWGFSITYFLGKPQK